MIKHLKSKGVRTGRIPLMGVRKQFQKSPLELSWILEDNKAMRGILDYLGCREYKRYRIYGKTL